MFDVSFSELLLILFVGLMVFGPEKLPQVVRTVSLWLGKARRTFNQIRTEIEREVGVEELKRDLHNQSIMDSLKEVHNDLQQTQRDLENIPYEIDAAVNTAHNDATMPAPDETPKQIASSPTAPAALEHRDSHS